MGHFSSLTDLFADSMMPVSLQRLIFHFWSIILPHFLNILTNLVAHFPPPFFFCRCFFRAESCIYQLQHYEIVTFQTIISHSLIFFYTDCNSVLQDRMFCGLSYFNYICNMYSYICNSHGPLLKHQNLITAQPHSINLPLFTLEHLQLTILRTEFISKSKCQ